MNTHKIASHSSFKTFYLCLFNVCEHVCVHMCIHVFVYMSVCQGTCGVQRRAMGIPFQLLLCAGSVGLSARTFIH